MQTVTNQLNTIESAISAGQLPEGCSSMPSGSLPPLLDRAVIIHLWNTMTRIYGHRWTSAFGDEIDPGRVWAATLRGLDMADVKRGLAGMVAAKMDWPPSAIQFRKLCEDTADETGLPAAGHALAIFLRIIAQPSDRREWSAHHPAIYWCYQQIGSYDCARLDADDVSRKFRDLWPEAVERAKVGELVAPPELQIEDKSHQRQPLAREEVSRRARALLADLNEKNTAKRGTS